MIIGITGSLSSGKSTAAKLVSKNKYPLFSADKVVKNLYSSFNFKKKVSKKLRINSKNFKNDIKNKLLNKEISLKRLTQIIHPFVRKNMRSFIKKHKNKRVIVLEIPLLIESKLLNYFDIIILIMSSKKYRLQRYLKNGGSQKFFNFLDKKQLNQQKKTKYCDFIIVNNKSKKNLKKKVNDIMIKINE
jgi:dephospho-CoA kinase